MSDEFYHAHDYAGYTDNLRIRGTECQTCGTQFCYNATRSDSDPWRCKRCREKVKA